LKLYTGDDLNYVELIEGDGEHVSHGLLGIFDPIAPAVVVALDRLAAGDNSGYHEILDPTVALSRKMFEAPTRFYKAGVVFPSLDRGPPNSLSHDWRDGIGAQHFALR
jgi:hypothetical protein